MSKPNPANIRIKRRYFDFLEEAKGLNSATVDLNAKAISRFELYTKHKDFKTFRIEQAVAFKRALKSQRSETTGGRLSIATIHSTLTILKRFFQWLANQPGYRSRFTTMDAEYFSPSEKDACIAGAVRPRSVPTLEQLNHVIRSMPSATIIQRRDRAIIAFATITGARNSAIVTARLKHVNLQVGTFTQDPVEVKTKNSKFTVVTFFPLGDCFISAVREWILELQKELLFSEDEPLFPKSACTLSSDNKFEHNVLDRSPWASTTPIRGVFKKAFKGAGLPYCNPHSIRKMLGRLAGTACGNNEVYKAWSQNLSHNSILTTFCNYGDVEPHRQHELISGITIP